MRRRTTRTSIRTRRHGEEEAGEGFFQVSGLKNGPGHEHEENAEGPNGEKLGGVVSHEEERDGDDELHQVPHGVELTEVHVTDQPVGPDRADQQQPDPDGTIAGQFWQECQELVFLEPRGQVRSDQGEPQENGRGLELDVFVNKTVKRFHEKE